MISITETKVQAIANIPPNYETPCIACRQTRWITDNASNWQYPFGVNKDSTDAPIHKCCAVICIIFKLTVNNFKISGLLMGYSQTFFNIRNLLTLTCLPEEFIAHCKTINDTYHKHRIPLKREVKDRDPKTFQDFLDAIKDLRDCSINRHAKLIAKAKEKNSHRPTIKKEPQDDCKVSS